MIDNVDWANPSILYLLLIIPLAVIYYWFKNIRSNPEITISTLKPFQGIQKGLKIKVEQVDPETLEVKYIVGSNSYFGDRKYGLSTVDSVIAMATQPSLFNPADYRIQPGQLKR